MLKKFILALFLFFMLMATACGRSSIATPPEVPTANTTSLEDPCAAENLPRTVQQVNDLMREFDEGSGQVSNTPAQQLPELIANLQRIRRNAEDTQIPACLGQLKTHQLNHMNLLIQTLIASVGGASNEELQAGLDQARKEHDLYSLEMVRLLGITLAPVTPTAAAP